MIKNIDRNVYSYYLKTTNEINHTHTFYWSSLKKIVKKSSVVYLNFSNNNIKKTFKK